MLIPGREPASNAQSGTENASRKPACSHRATRTRGSSPVSTGAALRGPDRGPTRRPQFVSCDSLRHDEQCDCSDTRAVATPPEWRVRRTTRQGGVGLARLTRDEKRSAISAGAASCYSEAPRPSRARFGSRYSSPRVILPSRRGVDDRERELHLRVAPRAGAPNMPPTPGCDRPAR
jgi:hypothetical protein